MSYTKTIYRKHLQAHDLNTGAHKYLKVIDKKATTVAGGNSSAATWNVRELTDIIDNTVSTTVQLDTNLITLPAGVYYCRVNAPTSGSVGATQVKLVNTSDSNVELVVGAVSQGSVSGKFTLAEEGTVQVLQYTTSAVAISGLGAAGSIGGDEIYTVAEFWMEQDPLMNKEI